MSDKDWRPVIKACEAYMERAYGPTYLKEDMSEYIDVIFEAAMEAVYGKEVWNMVVQHYTVR